MGRDTPLLAEEIPHLGFNPRAHVGRDKGALKCPRPITVSIHAPTWGATELRKFSRRCLSVSIHAPTWGATRRAKMPSTYNKFQSTRPRGARRKGLLRSSAKRGFNPRAHVGRDGFVAAAVAARTAVSIHAPTWGATVAFFANKALALFQSTRPRGARRSTAQPGSAVMNVSIHAPTWGATRYGHKLPRERMVSIHAPPWGATKLPTLQVLPA